MLHFVSHEKKIEFDGLAIDGENLGISQLKLPRSPARTIIKVTVNFMGRAKNFNDNGFYYDITCPDFRIQAKSPVIGIFQPCQGWQSATRISIFELDERAKPKFSVLFKPRGLAAVGKIKDFILTAEVYRPRT